jgi:hypothetical protein
MFLKNLHVVPDVCRSIHFIIAWTIASDCQHISSQRKGLLIYTGFYVGAKESRGTQMNHLEPRLVKEPYMDSIRGTNKPADLQRTIGFQKKDLHLLVSECGKDS